MSAGVKTYRIELRDASEPFGLDYRATPDGVVVSGTAFGTPAARAAVERGVLLSINGAPVRAVEDLKTAKERGMSQGQLVYELQVRPEAGAGGVPTDPQGATSPLTAASPQAGQPYSPAVNTAMLRPRMPKLVIPPSLSKLSPPGGTLLYIRAFDRVGRSRKHMVRAFCISRRFLVVVEPETSNVKRVIRIQDMTEVIHENSSMGMYTLIRCGLPEHDLLLHHSKNKHQPMEATRKDCDDLGDALRIVYHNATGKVLKVGDGKQLLNSARLDKHKDWRSPKQLLEHELPMITSGRSPLWIDEQNRNSPQAQPPFPGQGGAGGAPGQVGQPDGAPAAAAEPFSRKPSDAAPHGSDHQGPLPPPPRPPPPDQVDNPPPPMPDIRGGGPAQPSQGAPPSHPYPQPQGGPGGSSYPHAPSAPQPTQQEEFVPSGEDLMQPHVGYEGPPPQGTAAAQPSQASQQPGGASQHLGQPSHQASQPMRSDPESGKRHYLDAPSQHQPPPSAEVPSPKNSLTAKAQQQQQQHPPVAHVSDGPQPPPLSYRHQQEIRLLESGHSHRSREDLQAFLHRASHDPRHPSHVESMSVLGHRLLEEGARDAGVGYLKRAADFGDARAIETLRRLEHPESDNEAGGYGSQRQQQPRPTQPHRTGGHDSARYTDIDTKSIEERLHRQELEIGERWVNAVNGGSPQRGDAGKQQPETVVRSPRQPSGGGAFGSPMESNRMELYKCRVHVAEADQMTAEKARNTGRTPPQRDEMFDFQECFDEI